MDDTEEKIITYSPRVREELVQTGDVLPRTNSIGLRGWTELQTNYFNTIGAINSFQVCNGALQ
jgi:hypothetical protein